MALIALLSANEPAAEAGLRGLLRFGGRSLLGHQARQALDLGATRFVIMTQSGDPALPQLVDRLSARPGVQAALARDLPSLGRLIGPDDEVLVLADGLIAPQGSLAALGGEGPSHLLVVPMTAVTAGCERIDPRHGWAGAARLRGRILLDMLDMLGDWAFASTLVRACVQAGARRVELSPELVTEGRLAIIADQAAADIAFEALSRSGEAAGQGSWRGPDGWLAARFAPQIATLLVRRQTGATLVRRTGLGLAAAAVAVAAGGWPGSGLMLGLLALGLGGVARAMDALTRDEDLPAWQLWLGPVLALLLLAVCAHQLLPGWPDAMGWVAILAPASACGLALLAMSRSDPAVALPGWAWPTPAAALAIAAFGHLLGRPGAAMALIFVLATAMLALWIARGDGRTPR